MTDPEVLTVKEAAALLRVSAWTIREHARDGTLPGLYLGVWRFSREAIMAEMHERSAKSAPNVLQPSATTANDGQQLTAQASVRKAGR